MTGFFALLRLQLLSRFADLKPRNLKAHFQEKKGRFIGKLAALLVAFAYLGGFLIFMENAILNALLQMGMPDLLLGMAVFLAMGGTLIMSFFFIMSALYFGRDGALLASLPVKTRTVLSAKLAQVWVSEAGFSLLIILPASILYGLKTPVDALFYPRALIVALCAPVLPIVIVAFVSTLLIRLSALWKHRDAVATVSGIVFLMAYMFLAMNMGSMTGSGDAPDMVVRFMQSNSARVEAITRLFPPAAWAGKGLLGDWGQLGLFLAASAAAAAFSVWALGFWYRKLSLLQGETPAEHKKGGVKKASYGGGSAFKALCLREIRQILRVPTYATNSIPTSLMPLLMTVMMYVIMNNALAQDGETMQMLLDQIPHGLILPILTAVMAYMAGMNPALSTSVSREGRGHDFMNALPVSYQTIIRSKLAVGYALSVAGVVAAAAVIIAVVPAFAPDAAMAAVLCLLYTYLTSCLCLTGDVKHPKLDWVTEQEAMKQNFSAVGGMFLGWGILIALGGATYLLYTWEVNLYLYFLIMAALLALGGFFARKRLMKAAEKYYCQG